MANTVGLVPSGVLGAWLYLRWRRLLPFHVSHWLTDVFVAVMTVYVLAGTGGQ